MGRLLSPDGEISSFSLKIFIWSFDIASISAGCLLLILRRKIRFPTIKLANIIFLLISLVVGICCGEVVLRLLGYETWNVGGLGSNDISVDGTIRYSVADSLLGHTITPGKITLTMPTGLRFSSTHLANRSRATHQSPNETKKKAIWTLGCSFTYGWAVDDTGSYPWKLQDLISDYEIVNFGISGYGTLQSVMWFEQNLESLPPPKAAILGYVSWHQERNILSRSWKKNLSAYQELSFIVHPYAYLGSDQELGISRAPITYSGLPLIRHSVFMNLLDDLVNKIDLRIKSGTELTIAIIDSFSVAAKRSGAIPIIAFMTSDPTSAEILRHCEENNIPGINIAVDLAKPENSLLPLDPHPSELANQRYATMLADFLKNELILQP